MRRGTTQTLVFTLPFLASIEALYITFSQKGTVVLEKTLDDVEYKDGVITCPLSQADTLKLQAPGAVFAQIRFRDTLGNAHASDEIRLDAEPIFKDGEI